MSHETRAEKAQRYKDALEKIQYEAVNAIYTDIWSIANEALNPPPEFEDVEVKRRVVVDSTGAERTYTTKAAAEMCTVHAKVVELTGTYKREVKV